MSNEEEISIDEEKFNSQNYYSLLELLEKLGKEEVGKLVKKGNPRRVTQGDMIYFLKEDVDKILGVSLKGENIDNVIIDDTEEEINIKEKILENIVFTQTLIKRYKIGKEEDLYKNKVLDLSKEILYGRSHGDPQDQKIFKKCGIISSLHGKMYLDEEGNLLYENLGANKSKVRGCNEKNYSILAEGEIGVLISHDLFENLISSNNSSSLLIASIKIGYQLKPHFIIRIKAKNKNKNKR